MVLFTEARRMLQPPAALDSAALDSAKLDSAALDSPALHAASVPCRSTNRKLPQCTRTLPEGMRALRSVKVPSA
jgi:hypothetical protein